ncbi:Putative hemolysin [Legionella beliardensis]|uniref:Hemolysin n=1 Tax=Legionella beliardensis TaxID=91822 RepID=A0A378I5S4_9GAMM|nr:hypothetical protein [Legionella beliardensis]STX30202.1 Putative hemolysin [Legionella beliardensis]
MKTFLALICSLFINNLSAATTLKQALSDYCNESGGQVETMPAQFGTSAGLVEGFSKNFCTFKIDNGFIAVGLTTFASSKPNIAATLIKQLPPIAPDSPLLKGKYNNPSLNFCKNLGGSSISFLVASGGFSNALGQTDICVFGDGSMVSGWSLLYIANGRTGYHVVREKIKADPLTIQIPNQK